jgi:TonB family protein
VRAWRVALAGVLTLGAAGCHKAPPAEQGGAGGSSPGVPPDQEPPVALNADSPIQYPPRLYDQKVEGEVVLRLFVDSVGRLLPESSRVAESSGYPALDSAALTGARKLRFAPARRHGLAIATAFLQPVEFRHPPSGGPVAKGEPDSARRRPARVRAPAAARTPRPDTLPRMLDTAHTGSGAVPAKSDTNAVPH